MVHLLLEQKHFKTFLTQTIYTLRCRNKTQCALIIDQAVFCLLFYCRGYTCSCLLRILQGNPDQPDLTIKNCSKIEFLENSLKFSVNFLNFGLDWWTALVNRSAIFFFLLKLNTQHTFYNKLHSSIHTETDR